MCAGCKVSSRPEPALRSRREHKSIQFGFSIHPSAIHGGIALTMAKSMLCVIAALSSLRASGGDFAAGDNITADRKLAADNNFTDGRQFTTDAGDDNTTSSAGGGWDSPQLRRPSRLPFSCKAFVPTCRELSPKTLYSSRPGKHPKGRIGYFSILFFVLLKSRLEDLRWLSFRPRGSRRSLKSLRKRA